MFYVSFLFSDRMFNIARKSSTKNESDNLYMPAKAPVIYAYALYDYSSKENEDLNFKAGDLIQVSSPLCYIFLMVNMFIWLVLSNYGTLNLDI